MRVLISGASGLLGHYACGVFSGAGHDVTGTHNTNPAKLPGCHSARMDCLDAKSCGKIFAQAKPGVFVHCAAMTNVDYCEERPDEAMAANGEASGMLAALCRKHSALMVYVSTDFVFDGKRGNYSEDDAPNPISQYGKSKLAGERLARENCDELLIARLSVVYGNEIGSRKNFASWLVGELAAGKEVRVVKDQFASPTYAKNAAQAIAALVSGGRRGVYHACGSERASRLDFAMRIAEGFGLDQKLVKPVLTAELGQKAARPKDSSMSVAKIAAEAGFMPCGLKEGIAQMKSEKKA